jgi:hypothetical protein
MSFKVGDIVKLTYNLSFTSTTNIVLIEKIDGLINNNLHIVGKLLWSNGSLKRMVGENNLHFNAYIKIEKSSLDDIMVE